MVGIKNMKFSTKAEYGLRAMVNLAKHYPGQKTAKLISKEEDISQKYLERLLATLCSEGIVDSSKGKSGGYVLARDPKKISAGEIIEVLEGSISPMRCAGEFCAAEKRCLSSIVWIELGQQIRKTLYSIKLDSLIRQKRRK